MYRTPYLGSCTVVTKAGTEVTSEKKCSKNKGKRLKSF